MEQKVNYRQYELSIQVWEGATDRHCIVASECGTIKDIIGSPIPGRQNAEFILAFLGTAESSLSLQIEQNGRTETKKEAGREAIFEVRGRAAETTDP